MLDNAQWFKMMHILIPKSANGMLLNLNPNQVEVCMDGQSTFVTMRPHSRKSLGAKSKDSGKKVRKSNSTGICKDKTTNSPSDSEAYGTGSSVSEANDNACCNPHGEDPSREDQPSRHSR